MGKSALLALQPPRVIEPAPKIPQRRMHLLNGATPHPEAGAEADRYTPILGGSCASGAQAKLHGVRDARIGG